VVKALSRDGKKGHGSGCDFSQKDSLKGNFGGVRNGGGQKKTKKWCAISSCRPWRAGPKLKRKAFGWLEIWDIICIYGKVKGVGVR